MNPSLLRGIVLVTIALIVAIVAAALPYWWTTSPFVGSDGISTDVGLFKTCSAIKIKVSTTHTESGPKSCSENTDAPSWLRGIQACVIISIILAAISLPLAAIYCYMFNVPALILAAGILNFAAGALLEIGAIIFLVMVLKEAGFKVGVGIPHVSFYLSLVAGGMLSSGGKVLYKCRLLNAAGQALTASGNTTCALTSVNAQSNPTPGHLNLAMRTNAPDDAVEDYTVGRVSERAYTTMHTRPAYMKSNHYMNMDGTS